MINSFPRASSSILLCMANQPEYLKRAVVLSIFLWILFICRAHKNNSGRGISVMEGLMPFCPLFLSFGLFTLWALISPSDILNAHSKLFVTAVGILYSNITVSQQKRYDMTKYYHMLIKLCRVQCSFPAILYKICLTASWYIDTCCYILFLFCF